MADVTPIISPEALAADIARPDLRLVDVRWVLGSPGAGRAAYAVGHIPGAIHLDMDTDLVAAHGPGRHPLPSPDAFCDRMEAVGVNSEDEVVAYDDVGGWVAARLWWMLDDLGHARVRVLDGGYPAWVAAGLPVTTEPPPIRARGRLRLRDSWTNVIDRAGVTAGLGTVVLLDARGGPRYRGEVEPIDLVAGHIPTARHAPTDDNLGPDGRLLDPVSLAGRFRALGADGLHGPVVTACGSGVSACFNSLAMRIAGLPDPILYPGSYSDWSRAGLPIAVGPEPGDPPADMSAATTAR